MKDYNKMVMIQKRNLEHVPEIRELENRDAFFYFKFLSIYVNNCFQMHLTLPNLIKLKLT